MNRGYKFVTLCIVFSMLIVSFSVSSSAAINNLSGTPYSSSYIPVCQYYPLASNLPYGENTFCVCYERASTTHDYYFFTSAYELLDNSGQSSTDFDNLGFFVGFGNTSDDWTLNIQSGSKVIHIMEYINGDTFAYTREDLGTFTNISSGSDYPGYYSLVVSLPNPNNLSNKKIISNLPYCWNGFSADQLLGTGQFSSVSDFVRPYYIASYPDNVSAAIQSLDDYAALMTQYYTTLNSRLNALSIDNQILRGQVDDLTDIVIEYGEMLVEQGDLNYEQYSEDLSNAQAEIESNANAAAQSAADSVNNAGEDMSDIDDNVDEVNDIVEQLDEWISTLDNFADHIDSVADDVEDSIKAGTTVVNNFLGICPPIVIALFAFALVFLVVRKIIGR